jgi:hypothetical protein
VKVNFAPPRYTDARYNDIYGKPPLLATGSVSEGSVR